ncbi:DEFI6 protein, partial [Pomatorhinus ruficollis]|nr:DEFI6 protein [Pomatorhinus ruficollis]
MDLRAELLKSIWYAFTALDVEKSGKVSKSQLKVLSHNLYTVLCIPHDPVALEEHFRDDDDGPVSSQGYMPYLNKYILDKVSSLSSPRPAIPHMRTRRFLGAPLSFWKSHALVVSPSPQVEYLLKKICTAMNVELNSCELDDYLSQEPQGQGGLTVWQFLDMVNSGRFLRGIEQEAISMAVEEVYQEVIEDGYLWKKGQLRRNWSERWFMLKPSSLSYYMSEERKEKKGSIVLDKHCCVEVLPDRDGKRCMFCVKTSSRTYEMSASDTRQRQEWTLAIQTAIRLQAEGKKSLHKDLKQKRREQREQREQRKAAKEEETQRLKQLQEEKERKLQELELLKEAQRQAEILLQEEEQRRRQQHEEMQRTLEIQLREAEQVGASHMDRGAHRVGASFSLPCPEQHRDRTSVSCPGDKVLVSKVTLTVGVCEERRVGGRAEGVEESELGFHPRRNLQSRPTQGRKTHAHSPRSGAEGHQLTPFLHPCQAAQRKLRQASTNVKHWNVQMNRLMHPIGPGDKRTNVSGGAFAGYQPLLSRRDSSLK